MAENDLDPVVIKKTQEMLGKFIKKPVLSEKLLNKPPFRFIHDIINAIVKETGFLDGVYTKSELISDNIKDRDAKINFLQKLIDVIKLTTKENVSARPSKIVAGHEAEKTNELLQLIGMAIEQKLDHKQAIETIQAKGKAGKIEKPGKKKISSKEPTKLNGVKEVKDAPVLRKELSNEKKSKTQTATKKSTISKSGTKLPAKAKDENFTKKDKIEKEISNEQKIEVISKKPGKPLSPAINENINSVEVRRSSIESNKSNKEIQLTKVSSIDSTSKEEIVERAPKKEPVTKPTENLQQTQENGSEKTVDIAFKEGIIVANEDTPPERKKSSSKRKKSHVEGAPNTATKERSKRSSGKSNSEEAVVKLPETQLNISQDPLKDASVSVPAPTLGEVKRQSTFVREESQNDITIGRPRTSLRPPSARRPGAPRRRDKNVEIILQPNDQVKLAGIHVRLDNFGSQLEDDGENLIIVENSTADDTMQPKNEPQLDDESQQGHLVQQILQTQKELVQVDSEAIAANDIDIVTFNKRQSSARQMDSLRDVIQHLTRSINPLGKLMDFLPEDIDSMHMELNMWRDSYIQAASELRKEKSLTETALEPMKLQLTQINANIKEHKDMIDQMRGKILQNSEKIDKLLAEQ